MTARCEMTELPVDMCAHCLGHDDRDTPHPTDLTVTGLPLEARYPGRCAGCGRPYPSGTEIRRIPDGWFADCCTQET